MEYQDDVRLFKNSAAAMQLSTSNRFFSTILYILRDSFHTPLYILVAAATKVW